MLIIRPIKESDTEAFCNLVFEMTLGMRSLPKNKDQLNHKINHSIQSFKKTSFIPDNEFYLFVLEDLSTKQIVGCCSIRTKKGIHNSDQFYRHETVPLSSSTEVSKDIKVLKVVSPKEDITKIGSLYLHPDYQHHGLGHLISFCRFLFAAGHPKRFYPDVIAEMRGIINSDETCPFWEGIGHHFCNIPFSDLMSKLDMDKSITSQILPAYPIYTSLLPQDVQAIIGSIHDSTTPAMKMLTREGFALTQDLDLFDGGPIIRANLHNLHSVKESKVIVLDKITSGDSEGQDAILANDRLDFRACYGKILITQDDKAILGNEVAAALNLQHGDQFRYI